MQTLILVSNENDWHLHIPNVQVVSARSYLTDPIYSKMRNAKVFNLCRSYRYQSIGYYASLLAAARGHRPVPSANTIQDMKSQTMVRFVSEDLDELIQSNLGAPARADKFTLSIYFGQNMAKQYERLSLELYRLFPAPLLRAQFAASSGKWHLQSIGPIEANEIPEEHKPFVVESAQAYFAGKIYSSSKQKVEPRYDLAILYDPAAKQAPSNKKALQKFIKAAESLGMNAELITKEDYSSLAEFDALFIRETTAVNHHTYRFARRAQAEGLVVIDDPESILKCTNKVYMAELLERHGITAPKTVIVHRDNIDTIIPTLGLPCILKQPDSSFSQGVVKVEEERDLYVQVEALLDKSELILAQEFVSTPFDWRIGIIDQKPFFACKYYMARAHWQIVKRFSRPAGQDIFVRYGKIETLPIELVPKKVVRTALKAANLIGNGLYGVDVKEVNRKCYLIEVNENPNIDVGVEDGMLKDDLYLRIMEVFLRRLEAKKLPKGES